MFFGSVDSAFPAIGVLSRAGCCVVWRSQLGGWRVIDGQRERERTGSFVGVGVLVESDTWCWCGQIDDVFV